MVAAHWPGGFAVGLRDKNLFIDRLQKQGVNSEEIARQQLGASSSPTNPSSKRL
jgi:hypothetical protein